MATDYDITDRGRAAEGRRRIDWAYSEMPVLQQLQQRFAADRPLAGLRIGACLHVTTETANLLRVLQAGGAEVALCASNPLSTQDDVAAALVAEFAIPVFARCDEDNATYYRHLDAVLAHRPQITLDDGADLISRLHQTRPELLQQMLGGTEETTTGVIRLRAMAADEALGYPVIAVNDAMTKHLFDNRYGTGQSTLDGIIRATNILLAGRTFTVVGYGWCGRGIAMRARGHGAHVIVTEVEPLRALEAVMDGFTVMPLLQAAPHSDFIVTASGDKHVVDLEHLEAMKDGCVLANSGHFNVEINIPALEAMSREVSRPRSHVQSFHLKDGRVLRLLAEGRLVNLAAAEGHPAAVMDMSFANQSLAVAHLAARGAKLERAVHPVPAELDAEVAELKLAALGVAIDSLTAAQQRYLHSWQEGPEMAREKDIQHMLEDIRLEVELTQSYTGYKRFSPAVMDAMAEVPRHRFVPEEMQLFAYANGPLAIGHGQTISQPYIVALMSELLAVGPDATVLEIGTGSGYQTAVLARLVKQVYSIEVVAPLAEAARDRLARLGYDNVETRRGDGYLGWPEHAPYDGIIVTAAAPHVPEPLTAQLKTGGRLVIPVGRAFGSQELLLVQKGQDGELETRNVLPVAFVPLTRNGGH